ncbi:hypothetical protein MMC07_007606 [Pseudocyphellaria aurata]|nr:hypothetical protein [Pseudocyphellaria aurata]
MSDAPPIPVRFNYLCAHFVTGYLRGINGRPPNIMDVVDPYQTEVARGPLDPDVTPQFRQCYAECPLCERRRQRALRRLRADYQAEVDAGRITRRQMEVNLEDFEYEHQEGLLELMDYALGYDIERLHQRIENAVSQGNPPANNPPANNPPANNPPANNPPANANDGEET